MTLQWSPQAIDDLILLRHHISTEDPAAAKRVALHILHCAERLLLENPQLGHPGRVPGTRELAIPKTPLRCSLPDAQRCAANLTRLSPRPPMARAPLVSGL
jgi:toxin ParE1/3/4